MLHALAIMSATETRVRAWTQPHPQSNAPNKASRFTAQLAAKSVRNVYSLFLYTFQPANSTARHTALIPWVRHEALWGSVAGVT